LSAWNLARIFAFSLGIAFSGALMPGPMLVVVAAQSHRRGWTAGPLVVLGHGALELALVAAAVTGLGAYLREPPAGLVVVLAFAGGAVLGVMGVGMLRAAPKVELRDPAAAAGAPGPAGAGARGAVLAGVWSSLVNPYWSVWWLCAGLGLVAWSGRAGAAGLAAFFAGHILADLIWYTFVSLSFANGSALMSPRVFRALVVAGAVLLLYMAAAFAYLGARTLATGVYEAPSVSAPELQGLGSPGAPAPATLKCACDADAVCIDSHRAAPSTWRASQR